jgi:integrase
MGRKRTPGMYNRDGVWHIDKKIHGRRLCESTGTGKLEEAEKYLAKRCDELRQAVIFGVRPVRTFREAGTRYLSERQDKKSFSDDARTIKQLDQYIGHLPLHSISMNSLQAFIQDRQKAEIKTRTINYGLQVIRHLLNLATAEWFDENGLTWLQSASKIKLLPEIDKRKPYPLSWDEQVKLFQELPEHLEAIALFAVNTGCREQEVCQLQWKWESWISEINTSVFIIPGNVRKNGCPHVVVLNRVAKSIVESLRNNGSDYVFTYRCKPLCRINNSAWKKARTRAGLEEVRVHDLRHTFGRRLRSAGVSFEDRQDLLGHKSSRMTTHYSCAEIQNLIDAAEKACERSTRSSLSLLKLVPLVEASSRKSPASSLQKSLAIG